MKFYLPSKGVNMSKSKSVKKYCVSTTHGYIDKDYVSMLVTNYDKQKALLFDTAEHACNWLRVAIRNDVIYKDYNPFIEGCILEEHPSKDTVYSYGYAISIETELAGLPAVKDREFVIGKNGASVMFKTARQAKAYIDESVDGICDKKPVVEVFGMLVAGERATEWRKDNETNPNEEPKMDKPRDGKKQGTADTPTTDVIVDNPIPPDLYIVRTNKGYLKASKAKQKFCRDSGKAIRFVSTQDAWTYVRKYLGAVEFGGYPLHPRIETMVFHSSGEYIPVIPKEDVKQDDTPPDEYQTCLSPTDRGEIKSLLSSSMKSFIGQINKEIDELRDEVKGIFNDAVRDNFRNFGNSEFLSADCKSGKGLEEQPNKRIPKTDEHIEAIDKTMYKLLSLIPEQFSMSYKKEILHINERKAVGGIVMWGCVANYNKMIVGDDRVIKAMGLTDADESEMFCPPHIKPKHLKTINLRQAILMLWYYRKEGSVIWDNDTLEDYLKANPIPSELHRIYK